jgi:hypothetical protein
MTRFPALTRAVARYACGLAVWACAGMAQAVVVEAGLADFGGATLITFDEVAAGSTLSTQYAAQGIVDFDATVLGERGYAKTLHHAMFLLPGAVSGQRVGFMGASIEFAAGVDRVGVWLYKHNGAQFLTALDAGQNVLQTVAADAASTDSPFYDFVGLRSDARDIRYVVIANKDLALDAAWDIDGQASFYDDLVYSPITAVPEPQTWMLLLLCLALMGAIVRRRN